MFCNFFTAIEYAKNADTCFLSALGPETEEKIRLAKNEIRFDL